MSGSKHKICTTVSHLCRRQCIVARDIVSVIDDYNYGNHTLKSESTQVIYCLQTPISQRNLYSTRHEHNSSPTQYLILLENNIVSSLRPNCISSQSIGLLLKTLTQGIQHPIQFPQSFGRFLGLHEWNISPLGYILQV